MCISVHVVNTRGEGMPGVEVELSAYDWQDTKVTDADGYCEFAGLKQEIDFAVRLTQLACTPVQIRGRWGTKAQVDFVER